MAEVAVLDEAPDYSIIFAVDSVAVVLCLLYPYELKYAREGMLVLTWNLPLSALSMTGDAEQITALWARIEELWVMMVMSQYCCSLKFLEADILGH